MNNQIPGKLLYQEKCGECDIFISHLGNTWIVGGTLDGEYRERMFTPTAYESEDTLYGESYSKAIACYNDTLEHASEIYHTPRTLPERPNFIAAINI